MLFDSDADVPEPSKDWTYCLRGWSIECKDEDEADDDEDEDDSEEKICPECGEEIDISLCTKCGVENICENCQGEGGDHGINEDWVCHACLPTCNACKKKLISSQDECCGKGRSDDGK